MAAIACGPFRVRSRGGAYAGTTSKKYPMSLVNLKRKLAWSLRTAPTEPPAPADGQRPWPIREDDEGPFDAEDDFEGDGWTFWGV